MALRQHLHDESSARWLRNGRNSDKQLRSARSRISSLAESTSKRGFFKTMLHDVVAYLVMCKICICGLTPSMHVRIICVRPLTTPHDTIQVKDRHCTEENTGTHSLLVTEIEAPRMSDDARGKEAHKRNYSTEKGSCAQSHGDAVECGEMLRNVVEMRRCSLWR
jgi:hypothetical protein